MKRPILNYHAVGTTEAPDLMRWTIPRELFAAHLDLLVASGYRGVSVSKGLSDPSPNHVILTFDDGYEDFVTAAVPELEARGFTATLFVVVADVGAEASWMARGARAMASWDQLRAVHRAGFEIGVHSQTHRQLDLLSPQELKFEISDSRHLLEDQLGHPVEGFCYPHGFYRPGVRDAVIAEGYSYACGVRHKMSHTDDDQFALARIVINNDTSSDQLAEWLEGRHLRRGSARIERPLAAAFRAYRRTQLLRPS